MPDNLIAQAILAAVGEPLMSSTLVLPGEDMALTDPYDMQALLGERVEMIVDGGYCGFEFTTVVDMTEGVPQVLRVGKGDPNIFRAGGIAAPAAYLRGPGRSSHWPECP